MSQDTIHTLADSLEHLTGFFIVIVVLLLLWGMTAAIGRIFLTLEASRKERTTAAAAPTPATAAPAAAAPVASTEPEPEEIAAVSAAIAMLMGSRYRILSIRAPAADWSLEGRRQHFASHKIR